MTKDKPEAIACQLYGGLHDGRLVTVKFQDGTGLLPRRITHLGNDYELDGEANPMNENNRTRDSFPRYSLPWLKLNQGAA